MFRRAATLLPSIRISLWFRGYNSTFKALQGRTTGVRVTSQATGDPVHLTSRMIHAAVRYSLMHYTCLEESLCLWYLLRKQGISSQLRIGVRKTDGKFEAHAWVEFNGQAVNQPEASHLHYAAFEKEFPEPPVEPT